MKKLGITFMASAIIPFWLGLDKLLRYSSGESSYRKAKNAYVGGDAYNYIINGNYFTGYMVMTLILVLLGSAFLIYSKLEEIREVNRNNGNLIERGLNKYNSQ